MYYVTVPCRYYVYKSEEEIQIDSPDIPEHIDRQKYTNVSLPIPKPFLIPVVVVLGSVIVPVFMQMSSNKMRVHGFHILKEVAPSKNLSKAIPNSSLLESNVLGLLKHTL